MAMLDTDNLQIAQRLTASTWLWCMLFFQVKKKRAIENYSVPFRKQQKKTSNNRFRNCNSERIPSVEWKHSNSILFFFQLGQNVWRHLLSADKAYEYNEKLEFPEHIRMMRCTAFLPMTDVIIEFEKLQSTCPEDCEQIINYFEDNHIGRHNSTEQRQKAWFATERWNCCERVKKGYARTNNSVEGWNRNFVKLVNTKHLHYPNEKLKDGQKTQK